MHDFQAIFETAPDAYLLLGADPDFTIVAVNKAYLRATHTRREEIVGRPVFAIFPNNPATPEIDAVKTHRDSLQATILTRQPQEIPPTRYDVPRPAGAGGGFEQRFWRACNIPIVAPDGQVTHIIHRVEDVTSWVRLQETERSHHFANETLRSRVDATRHDLARRTEELEQTHRELAEQRRSLQEARVRVEAAVFSGQVATWIWEFPANQIRGDANLARWFRITPDQVRGTSLDTYLAAIDPEDASLVRRRVEESMVRGDGGEVEYRIVADRDHPRRVLARWHVERNDAGEAVRLAGVLLDISELRHATESLAHLREQLHLAAEAAEIGTFSWMLPDGALTWSDRCKEQFFLPPDAPIDIATFYTRVHPDDRAHVRTAVERSIADGSRYDVEFRAVAPDGRTRWIHASGRAFRNPSGQPAHFEGITLDVTRQKAIESELLESEARYRLVVDSLPDYAIFLLDDDGLVTHWNAGAERLLGYTGDDILGRSARILFTPEDQARGEPEKEIATAKSAGRAADDRWHMRKDGSRFYVTGLMTVVTDALGRRIGLAKIMRDVTERHAAAAERERLLESERAARAEAERTSRLKDDFLATLSHELRTPLNAILGWTQVLQESSNSPSELAEGLEIIERNTRVQAQLIEDLLDMSRIASGKVRLLVQRIDFTVVVAAAIDSVRTAADAKRIRIVTRFATDRSEVMGDRTRLQQVVWNLLSNAIKFTPVGGQVDVFLDHRSPNILLRVQDNGAGIAPDFLPHVFERFRQADASTTRQHGGLGLGLSIVMQLVELHGGEVRADSPGLGRGATFSVSLPLLPAPPIPHLAATGSTPPANHQTPPAGVDLSDVAVLVVEDEPDSANLVKRVLQSHGARVHLSSSVADALELFQLVHPHVLLSDIGMPNQDGYELIRRIRTLPGGADLPAAALSALAREQDIQRTLAAGFRHHLAKPVEPAVLVSTVAALARRG